LAKRHLSKAGYKILTAENGVQALEVYRENQSDIALVILDLIMPEMGGKECLEKLLEINPKVKTVVASGLSAYGPTRATIEAGAKGFVGKPFKGREMLRTIRDVLDEA
jgi:DNA-binding NtrC family response regulator